ncbi:hypothetical protein [Serratia sp. 2723]
MSILDKPVSPIAGRIIDGIQLSISEWVLFLSGYFIAKNGVNLEFASQS